MAAILQRKAMKKIVDDSQGKSFSMCRKIGSKVIALAIPKPDLNNLKNYVLIQQKLNYQLIKEYEMKAQSAEIHQVISNRFFDIFEQLCLISIDGMKQEQSLIRIEDLTNEIQSAQDELQRSEKIVEECAAHSAGESQKAPLI